MQDKDTPRDPDRSTCQTKDAGTSRSPVSARSRRYDPERKLRIIQACLDTIAERGVVGTSHRSVASRADVPLGSMTYHFAGIDDLVHQSFTYFAQQSAERFDARLAAASNRQEAIDAIIATVTQDLLGTRRDTIINLELYATAARNPSFRSITTQWMNSAHESLTRHFDARTSRLLDYSIEGITIHRALSLPARPREAIESETRDAIYRILSVQSVDSYDVVERDIRLPDGAEAT